jgi:hypothetical protein
VPVAELRFDALRVSDMTGTKGVVRACFVFCEGGGGRELATPPTGESAMHLPIRMNDRSARSGLYPGGGWPGVLNVAITRIEKKLRVARKDSVLDEMRTAAGACSGAQVLGLVVGRPAGPEAKARAAGRRRSRRLLIT